jgi:hypothetical protein
VDGARHSVNFYGETPCAVYRLPQELGNLSFLKLNTMKNFILLFAAFLVLNTNAFSQNTVKLNVNHQLGALPFLFNTAAQNNIGHDFNLSRLEYYVSQFTVVHDGGMETNINSIYTLIDASEGTTIDLGSHNITSVEAVKFHIGIDSATNHLDPASYDPAHALAPKLPSMHWGWASGYRFVALEGQGGANYNQTIALHALGNENYNEVEVLTTATAANNEVVIDIYADYARALENISVHTGSFKHGTDGDARTVLSNFKKHVFNSFPTSTVDFSEVNDFSVFPNPTTGKATIKLETTQDISYQVLISDMLGREVALIENIQNNQPIETNLEQSGLYFVQLVKNGQTVITKKLLVNLK